MSDVDISPIPKQSHPLAKRSLSKPLAGTLDVDPQARDAFIQHLVVKPSYYQQRGSRKSNLNYTSSIGSIVDRAPSSLFELKQQRLLAAADRKKRIIARIVSIVGLLIILLCAAIVTLTLKMAPKIDELVRTKAGAAGAHQLIQFLSRVSTSPTTTITIRQDNSTINGSTIEKSIFRTRRKSFI
ncbi:unnamed protein product [Adineta steineri]|uniref:Uncharacterized protein n=1 Tax=Adineta steineri TaxID=433720 RepID=A0A813XIL4_9BILA|nr:unnamed protein product [Adineta steineri]CAF0933189.1 unnamed protein product [Adineta steineri]CAF0970109.1 unnamed protein product [Adineta steineri]CAF1037461.1 unnamed protein product [Adineta steineri]CAF3665041.1 unnamed protein product [Adineta steineri]